MFASSLRTELSVMASKKIRTILVGVASPEDRSQPAVERAADLAAALNAEVILFHSAFETYLSGRPFFDSARLAKSRGALVASRQQALEKLAARLAQRQIKTRCVVVWEEPAYAAVLRAAIRDDADLIVIGAHRPRTNRTPVLKQNDWELIRYSARPLLIVRDGKKHRGPIVAALDPTHANDKPAALDREIAKTAYTIAAGLNAELHAAHSIPDSSYPPGEITARDRKAARDVVQMRLAGVLNRAGVDARKVHVLDGLAELALPELLAKLDAQVLAVGALSRRWIKGFVFGNTVERLIFETTCDLLIVKPPGFEVKLPRARKQAIARPA
jgi:universal stress protein E